jgi:NCS2 family nucleobase:cation symporter-2
MKAAGTITVSQKTNDADWTRPDMQLVKSGVLADGLGTAAAGLLGGVGINTSTPVVGLAQATGVASRQVAVAVGAMFLLLGFLPKLTALIDVMPLSVIVPALLFAVTFIIINGLQVISSRLLDARRTLVLGLSLIAGLAVEVFPSIAAMAPRPLVPLVGSSLVLSTVLALA